MSPEEKEPPRRAAVWPQETPQAEQEQPATGAEEASEPAQEQPAAASEPIEDQPAAEASRPERASGERPDRRRRFGRRRVCAFCVENVTIIDYKDPVKLRRYLSDRARIEPRRKTGTCTKHQRWLGVALKRARHLALLPYTPEHIRLTGVFAPRR